MVQGQLPAPRQKQPRLGHRALVVVDSLERSAALLDGLKRENITSLPHLISGEPDLNTVLLAFRQPARRACDLVIGMGGGSALDTGKAVSALLTNPGDLFDYLEVIGKGLPLRNPSLPFIAIPTTAGTGSEVTRNAVIAIPEQRVKVSLRSPVMLPRLAIVDPDLTISLSPSRTASTGMDALTQLIEPFVCTTPNPLADSVCREGLSRVARSLLKALPQRDGPDTLATDMALASLCGGIALANAETGCGPWHGQSHRRYLSRSPWSHLCAPASAGDGNEFACTDYPSTRFAFTGALHRGGADFDRQPICPGRGWRRLGESALRGPGDPTPGKLRPPPGGFSPCW